MAARIWTNEQRLQQAEAIRRWKPWEQSTGPKTPEGKQVASQNAYQDGEWLKMRDAIKVLYQALKQQKEWIGS
jgi:hypothetical protein